MSDRSAHAWIARHDNGWVTLVEERDDGTWAAWALPGESAISGPDYIEMDEPTAKAAAEFGLREKSGHRECSPTCKTWELAHSL